MILPDYMPSKKELLAGAVLTLAISDIVQKPLDNKNPIVRAAIAAIAMFSAESLYMMMKAPVPEAANNWHAFCRSISQAGAAAVGCLVVQTALNTLAALYSSFMSEHPDLKA